MTHPQRQLADRRAAALTAWRGLERRMNTRRAIDNARCTHWIDQFTAARAAHLGA